ncbi:modular protein with glycoside hydrolase family 13 and glycosyltransferase family 5 domains [Gymnopus androsaceus JB14]|uniref:Modular protein with glycoside hydrolase family 13 and glycosyltransferase family 5 domains n=1 Tax=Gymnopus androsaceus JB14 TaxID=1447944 RepID=A0A6A4GUT6_9AGAR|nr:modular protein with glycoside hydrolase family 13 and glycosyltransferase family 5 domains [Gymnopus androsaceus JB14]
MGLERDAHQFPDGILTIMLNKPSSTGGISTGAIDMVLLCKGLSTNVMVFPNSDYNSSSLTISGDDYIFTHTAIGADIVRYSWNFGQNWTNWTTWEDTTIVNTTFFADADLFWDGDHIMVQYWSAPALSSAHVVHADYGWSGLTHRVPQFIATGVFNEWGNNQGIANTFLQVRDGL